MDKDILQEFINFIADINPYEQDDERSMKVEFLKDFIPAITLKIFLQI